MWDPAWEGFPSVPPRAGLQVCVLSRVMPRRPSSGACLYSFSVPPAVRLPTDPVIHTQPGPARPSTAARLCAFGQLPRAGGWGPEHSPPEACRALPALTEGPPASCSADRVRELWGEAASWLSGVYGTRGHRVLARPVPEGLRTFTAVTLVPGLGNKLLYRLHPSG